MNHTEIVQTYSDIALAGIIGQLTENGQWRNRLTAAKQEQAKREIKKLTQQNGPDGENGNASHCRKKQH